MPELQSELPALELLVSEYVELQREISLKHDEAKKMISDSTERINGWCDRECEPIQKELERIEPLIRDAVKRITADGKRKSVRLPSGTAGFRKSEPLFFFRGQPLKTSDHDFIEHVQNIGLRQFIKLSAAVDWAAMKKSLRITDDGAVCTADGEIVDGLTAPPQPDKFQVKPAAD